MVEAFGAMTFMTFFYIFFLWVGCAIYCSHIAGAKKRSSGLWLLGGLVFGIVALIAIAGIPHGGGYHCPFCTLEVTAKAKACPHCTKEFNPIK